MPNWHHRVVQNTRARVRLRGSQTQKLALIIGAPDAPSPTISIPIFPIVLIGLGVRAHPFCIFTRLCLLVTSAFFFLAHYNTTQHDTTQHNTTQHNTTPHNATQHTAPHHTTLHNTSHHTTLHHTPHHPGCLTKRNFTFVHPNRSPPPEFLQDSHITSSAEHQ